MLTKKNLLIITLIVAIFALVGVNGCKKHWVDDKLTITRESYSGNELRTDGYYVKGNSILTIYVLFQNGILLAGDSFYAEELRFRAAEMQTSDWQTQIKKNKYMWGAFLIRGNEISYERWVVPSSGAFPTFTWKGKITSNTEFVMTSMRDNRKGKTEVINEIYRFIESDQKPDSTNPFVK